MRGGVYSLLPFNNYCQVTQHRINTQHQKSPCQAFPNIPINNIKKTFSHYNPQPNKKHTNRYIYPDSKKILPPLLIHFLPPQIFVGGIYFINRLGSFYKLIKLHIILLSAKLLSKAVAYFYLWNLIF